MDNIYTFESITLRLFNILCVFILKKDMQMMNKVLFFVSIFLIVMAFIFFMYGAMEYYHHTEITKQLSNDLDIETGHSKSAKTGFIIAGLTGVVGLVLLIGSIKRKSKY